MSDDFDRLLAELAAAPPVSLDDPLLGADLGAYRILAPIGSGGMGRVYAARDRRLERRVAVKVLHPSAGGSEEALREARSLAALPHPNIAQVHDVGEAEGVSFIVMEFIEGRPLQEVVPTDGLGREDVIDLALPIARALAHMHLRSMVHGDLKPSNVLVGQDGRVTVIDFGLADREGSRASGRGTEGFVAPEVFQGAPITPASDVYAFGIVLRWLAVGEESDPAEPAFADLVERCLGAAAERPSADELIELLTALRGLERPLPRPARSRLWASVSLAALVVAAAVALGRWAPRVAAPGGKREVTTREFEAITEALAETRIGDVDISPDGSQIAYTEARGVVLTNPAGASGEGETIELDEQPNCVVWDADGSLFVTTDSYHYRLEAGAPVRVREVIASSCIRPGGQGGAMAEGRPMALSVRWPNGSRRNLLSNRAFVGALAWSPSGARLAYIDMPAEGRVGRLRMHELGSGETRTLHEGTRLVSDVGSTALAWVDERELAVGLAGRPVLGEATTLVSTPIDRWRPKPIAEFGHGLSALRIRGELFAAVRQEHSTGIFVGDVSSFRRNSGMAWTRVSLSSVDERGAAWSLDGRSIWSVRSGGGRHHIVRNHLDGFPQPLGRGSWMTSPQPLADGSLLAWEIPEPPNGRARIVRLAIQGLERRTLWSTPRAVSSALGRGRPPPREYSLACDREDHCALADRERVSLAWLNLSDGTLRPLGRVEGVEGVASMAVADGGERIALAVLYTPRVVVLDAEGRQRAEYRAPESCIAQSLAFDRAIADSLLLTVYCFEGPTYRLVRIDPAGAVTTLDARRWGWLTRPLSSPDGRQIAVSRQTHVGNVIVRTP